MQFMTSCACFIAITADASGTAEYKGKRPQRGASLQNRVITFCAVSYPTETDVITLANDIDSSMETYAVLACVIGCTLAMPQKFGMS